MVVLTGNQHVSVGVSALFPPFPFTAVYSLHFLVLSLFSLLLHCLPLHFFTSIFFFLPPPNPFLHPLSHWLVSFKWNNARKCLHCDWDFMHKAYWDVVPVVVVECGSVDNTDFGTSESISICITFHDTH